MVDVDKIQRDLDKYFKRLGPIKIDPSTGVVDVIGDVDLKRKTTHLPVKFGTVSGGFYCSRNKLVSLEGSPRQVAGGFYCFENRLESLEGAPDRVEGRFNCSHNQLTSLVGAPTYVGGTLYCVDNPLTNLIGVPEHVGGFWCTYSKSLPVLRLIAYPYMKLLGAPSEIEEIINKYSGQGKPGALKAAVELIRAGYKENARW